jgi:hypothetical protein
MDGFRSPLKVSKTTYKRLYSMPLFLTTQLRHQHCLLPDVQVSQGRPEAAPADGQESILRISFSAENFSEKFPSFNLLQDFNKKNTKKSIY